MVGQRRKKKKARNCKGGVTLPWLWRVGRLLVEGMTSNVEELGVLSNERLTPPAPPAADRSRLAFFFLVFLGRRTRRPFVSRASTSGEGPAILAANCALGGLWGIFSATGFCRRAVDPKPPSRCPAKVQSLFQVRSLGLYSEVFYLQRFIEMSCFWILPFEPQILGESALNGGFYSRKSGNSGCIHDA